ncbi:hypothetical protein M5K25_018068 [Dendrobium thyrsiflorum]|uniref:Pentatricopeptide repeat-containing protein n=1 Tax=Dendrobium thyrsiflorum TaxID=117978 RepID=A0ABD0UPA8_DENTH
MNLVGRRSISSGPNLRHEAESKVLALCNLGRLREALEAFCSYQRPLSSSTYSHLLQLCVDTYAKDEGKILHDSILARGYCPNLHLDTKFIIFFAKAGDLVSARKVFDEMPEKNVVSWTALMSGYSQNGFLEETLAIFSLMHRSCNKANQFTYASVLKACTGTNCIRSGLQIQGCIEKSRFRQNLYVNSALVDFHLKCGVLQDARSLFWRMEDRDVVLWNSMIGGHAVRGLAYESFRLFFSMLKEGKIPDHFTFASILRACGLVKDFLNADKMHSFIIKSGFASHYAVAGSLIDAYVKCRRISTARLLYDSLAEEDLVSCTTLISGYSKDRSYSRDALKLYCKINQTGMKIDNVILCSMLNVSANEASLDLGKQIHGRAVKNQSKHDVALHNSLVDMYAKSGELKDAHLAFDEMKSKNVISWTSLITGYGKHGQGADAVTLFKKMEDNGVEPNDITFLSLISACSHSGLTRKGMNFFDLMVNKYTIQPRSEHYACVVDLLGRQGLINEAYNFVKRMNFKPNISVWGAMLGACGIHDNRSLGEVAAGNLLTLYPQKSVNYVVLANIYAAASLWENAWRTRKLMQQKSSQKDAGCSSIYLPRHDNMASSSKRSRISNGSSSSSRNENFSSKENEAAYERYSACKITSSRILIQPNIDFEIMPLFSSTKLSFILTLTHSYHKKIFLQFLSNLRVIPDASRMSSFVLQQKVQITKKDLENFLHLRTEGDRAHTMILDSDYNWRAVNHKLRRIDNTYHQPRVYTLHQNARIIQHVLRSCIISNVEDRINMTPLLSIVTYLIMSNTPFDEVQLILDYIHNLTDIRHPQTKRKKNLALERLVSYVLEKKYGLTYSEPPTEEPIFFTNAFFRVLFHENQPAGEEDLEGEAAPEPTPDPNQNAYQEIINRFGTMEAHFDQHFDQIEFRMKAQEDQHNANMT